MKLGKPPLFLDYREFLVFAGVFLVIIGVRLGFYYQEYRAFIAKPFYYTYADVLQEFPKESRSSYYKILKLQTQENLTLFLNAHDYDFKDKRVRIQIFPNKRITFAHYLGSFYVEGFVKERLSKPPNRTKQSIQKAIEAQHTHPILQEFYNAIFLATPLSKKFRYQVSTLGISHLIALSGLHLSILSAVLFFVFWLLYHLLHRRYFPYRNAFVDIGLGVLIALGVYTYFVDMPPSLLRSYAMLMVGWIALVLGFELLSFGFLAVVTLMLVALFPKLIVSLALWLSISGVFYIYLLSYHAQMIRPKALLFVLFPIAIYLFMLPITHLVFDATSLYQLSSPLSSTLFTFFYPLSIALHLVGMGGLLDEYLLSFFKLGEAENYTIGLDVQSFVLYVTLSIASIWSRLSFYALVVVSIVYALSLYIPP